MECAKINVVNFMFLGFGFLQLADTISQLANDCHIQQQSKQFIPLQSMSFAVLTRYGFDSFDLPLQFTRFQSPYSIIPPGCRNVLVSRLVHNYDIMTIVESRDSRNSDGFRCLWFLVAMLGKYVQHSHTFIVVVATTIHPFSGLTGLWMNAKGATSRL